MKPKSQQEDDEISHGGTEKAHGGLETPRGYKRCNSDLNIRVLLAQAQFFRGEVCEGGEVQEPGGRRRMLSLREGPKLPGLHRPLVVKCETALSG